MNDGPARLIVKLGPNPEKEYFLTQSETTIGRSPGNTIAVPNPEVSRRHARIKRIGEKYQIEDWGSTNGTYVAGRRIMSSVILNHNDEIQLGESISFIFLSEPDEDISHQPDLARAHDQDVTIVDTSPQKSDIGHEKAPMPQPPPLIQTAADDEFILPEQETNTSRNRLRLLGCGCLIVLIPLLCLALLIFLDFYEQGRLLYCGPLRPIFEILLGPLGFSPICP